MMENINSEENKRKRKEHYENQEATVRQLKKEYAEERKGYISRDPIYKDQHKNKS